MASLELVASGLTYQNPKPYLRSIVAYHPTLVLFDDGEMLAGFDLGEAVEALDYHTAISRSTDGGQTWSDPVPLLDKPISPRRTTHSIRLSRVSGGQRPLGSSGSAGTAGRTEATHVAGFGGIYYRDDPEEGLVNRENLGYVPVDLLVMQSHDRGQTWTEPQIIEPPLQSPGWEICYPIVEVSGGRWLAPTATWRGWNGENPAGEQAVVLISDDQGKTWPTFGRMFDGRKSGVIHWEKTVIALQDGRVLAVSWAHDPNTGKNRPTPYTISHDRGETWAEPQPTGFLGQTCKGMQLRDGHIFCAYRRNDKPGLWGNLSTLEGDRWVNVAELPLWQGAASGMTGERRSGEELSALRFGSPTMAQLPGGDILVLFWCVEDLLTVIRWLRVRVK